MGKAMRKTEISGWMRQSSSKALRLSAVVLGVGILMSTHVARAGDDDDDDKTFEEKIIEGVMRGMGATNMDNSGIDYRERSPLVVPPKLDLPPPASGAKEVKVPNWPKDPDEARRKAQIAARKKANKDPLEIFMVAINNVKPMVEVKSRRVGGANYQVPVEVRPVRRMALAMRWLKDSARKRGEKSMSARLANELLEASEGRGGAMKKRDEVHRMAEANKAFSHFRF